MSFRGYFFNITVMMILLVQPKIVDADGKDLYLISTGVPIFLILKQAWA